MDQKEQKKLLARKKRYISELAGEIHDIVEDTLWSEYDKLPELSAKMQTMMAEFEAMKATVSVA